MIILEHFICHINIGDDDKCAIFINDCKEFDGWFNADLIKKFGRYDVDFIQFNLTQERYEFYLY